MRIINKIIGNESVQISSNIIMLLRYPLNEYKAFKKSDIAVIENVSHGLLKLQLINGDTYTIKGDLKEIGDEINSQ